MEILTGFPAVAQPGARKLILGSMPGVASLEATQYYAYPRNAFWKIIGDLFAPGLEMDYRARLQLLAKNHIALWDVVQSCRRPGSLDSAISTEGLVINDVESFFNQFPHIQQVFFNGQKAAGLFLKKVAPGLAGEFQYTTLPSTSPAYAAKRYAAKLEAWSVIRQ